MMKKHLHFLELLIIYLNKYYITIILLENLDLYQAMNCQKPCKLHCSQSCVDVKNCDWQNQINTFLNLYKLNKFSALLMNRIERYDEGLSAVIGLHEKGLLYLKEKDNEF